MTEREMMAEAMEIVEREYSVVGVTERFNDSLHVMEKYLPGDTYTKYWRKISREILLYRADIFWPSRRSHSAPDVDFIL